MRLGKGLLTMIKDHDVSATTSILVKRKSCPTCDAGMDSQRILYDVPYCDADLTAFLSHYYSSKFNADLFSDCRFTVLKCARCSLAYQKWVPSEEFIYTLYNDWLSSGRSPTPFSWTPDTVRYSRDAHELIMVSKMLQRPLSEITFLDYGMGWGKFCMTAMMMGCRTFGYDVALDRVEYGKQLGIKSVEIEQIPTLAADYISTEQVFEHLSEPYEVIEVLASALKIGGVLKISVPFAKDLSSRLRHPDWNARKYTRNSLNPIHPLEHVNCFTANSLKSLGQRVGLEVAKVDWTSQYRFLTVGGVNWRQPREVARALLRPFYRRFYPHKLYILLQKNG